MVLRASVRSHICRKPSKERREELSNNEKVPRGFIKKASRLALCNCNSQLPSHLRIGSSTADHQPDDKQFFVPPLVCHRKQVSPRLSVEGGDSIIPQPGILGGR